MALYSRESSRKIPGQSLASGRRESNIFLLVGNYGEGGRERKWRMRSWDAVLGAWRSHSPANQYRHTDVHVDAPLQKILENA